MVHKRACDSFYETDLADVLDKGRATRLLITGCATDFCVDTTIRAAASRDFEVVVVEDGHTTADRPHVDALSVMRHHNWVWENLIHPRTQIRVIPARDVVALIQSDRRRRGAGHSMILSARPSTEGGMARPRGLRRLQVDDQLELGRLLESAGPRAWPP